MMFKDLLMALDVFRAGTLIIALQSEFCILINYPEICHAYGSLIHRQAKTKQNKNIFFHELVAYMSVLRQNVFYFKLSSFFFHLCLSYTIKFRFDMFFYHFMPLCTFSHCLYLSGKLYKMCRLKPMYNRWSSRQQVTEGGSLSYGFQNVILLIVYPEQGGYKHERREMGKDGFLR